MSAPGCSITVNGETTSIASGCTVEILLAQLELGQKRVAVAVNRDVVPRGAYAKLKIGSGDQIEILEAVGGG